MVLVPRTEKYTALHPFTIKFHKSNQKLLDSGYEIMTNVELWNSFIQDSRNYKPEDIGIDNLEFAIWLWLSNKYNMHWTRKSEIFYGISGGHSMPGSFRKKDDVDQIYNYKDIKKLVRSNQFMPDVCDDFWGLSLPENTKIDTLQHSEGYRVYMLKNKYYQLKFSLQETGTSGFNYKELGERIKKELNIKEENYLYCDDILIELSCTFSRLWKGTKDQQEQKIWIEDLMNGLERDFSWEKLLPYVEEAYGM